VVRRGSAVADTFLAKSSDAPHPRNGTVPTAACRAEAVARVGAKYGSVQVERGRTSAWRLVVYMAIEVRIDRLAVRL